MAITAALRQSWEKNWPGVRCALSGGMPSFVFSPRPGAELTGVPVFCYHLVNGGDFERDLIHLQRGGYTTSDADGLLDHLEGRRPAPPRTVVLSFDDGPVNFYRVAFPLLQKYDMKAVAFVAPRFHEQTGDACDARPCTWDEIARMHESGLVDVQSHTFSHRYVPRWPEPSPMLGASAAAIEALRGEPLSMEEDFRRARDELEHRLSKTVRHLAFPRYNGTDQAIAIGRRLGYRAFWWGAMPRRPINRPADPATHIVRISGEFLRRLPGENRRSFTGVVLHRYGLNVRRWMRRA